MPAEYVADFVWRRQRNFNATVFLLETYGASVQAGEPLFKSFYITLDDNAEYGFNIDEVA